jgi:hypothetical protein
MSGKQCDAVSPRSGYLCCLDKGHTGPHESHGGPLDVGSASVAPLHVTQTCGVILAEEEKNLPRYWECILERGHTGRHQANYSDTGTVGMTWQEVHPTEVPMRETLKLHAEVIHSLLKRVGELETTMGVVGGNVTSCMDDVRRLASFGAK